MGHERMALRLEHQALEISGTFLFIPCINHLGDFAMQVRSHRMKLPGLFHQFLKCFHYDCSSCI